MILLSLLLDTRELKSRAGTVLSWAPGHRGGAQHTAPGQPTVCQAGLMGTQSTMGAGAQLDLYSKCREKLPCLSPPKAGGVSLQLEACLRLAPLDPEPQGTET